MVFKMINLIVLCITICLVHQNIEAFPTPDVRSDVVVTKFGPDKDEDPKEPGWMRRQLMRFGEVASRVGNVMGTHAVKITSAVDRICEVVKTIVPFLAAVCHVGQFGFCSATNSIPDQLSSALSPSSSLDLNIPD